MNQGPARSCLMPLILPSESDVETCYLPSKNSEMENQQNRDNSNVTKGKGRYTVHERSWSTVSCLNIFVFVVTHQQ